MRKRIFSLFMAFAMMLSLVPGTAMAAPADAETKRLYLPVVPEGEQMPEAEEESSLFELTEGEEDTIYIAEGTEEVSLRDICFTSAEEPAANGILYIVDEEGRVLAAGDDTVSYYEETPNAGEYCIGYVWFSDVSELTAGTYHLRLDAGNEQFLCVQKICVTASLTVTEAKISGLAAGCDSFDVELTISGFRTEAQLEKLSLSLVDEDLNEVASSSGAYKDISVRNKVWRLLAEMEVTAAIEKGAKYYLSLAYTGEEELISAVGGVTAVGAATVPVEIEDILIISPEESRLRISLSGLQEGELYRVDVVDGWDESYVLGQWEMTEEDELPEDGIVTISLEDPSAVTSGDFSEFYINVYRYDADYEEWEELTSEFLENTYAYMESEDVWFSPFRVDAAAEEIPFLIETYNGFSAYAEDAVVTLCADDGTLMAECDTMTVERDGGDYTISGVLTVTEPLTANQYYTAYYNDVMLGSVRATAELYCSNSFVTEDYYAETFWGIMGVVPAEAEVLNSSGSGRILLLDKDGATAEAGPMMEGSEGDTPGYQYFYHDFDSSLLQDGAVYSFVFEDADGRRCDILKDYTFDGTETEIDLTDYNHFYLMGIYEGEDTIPAQVYAYQDGVKNLTEETLEATVMSLEVRDEYGETVLAKAKGISGGQRDGAGYQFDIVLTNPLAAGEYTIYSNDEEIDYYYVGKAPSAAEAPRIYSVDAANAYVSGRGFSEDAVYTAKVYQGYTCMTETAFALTVGVDGNDLYFRKSDLSALTMGNYSMRIYQNGELLEEVPFVILGEGTVRVLIDDEDNDYNDENAATIQSTTVYISVSGDTSYQYIRWAETEEELEEQSFMQFALSDSFVHTFGDGEGTKTLFVELAKDEEGREAKKFPFTFRYSETQEAAVEVPAEIGGIQPEDTVYTITALTDLRGGSMMLTFISGDGKKAECEMTAVGTDDEGRTVYGYTFSPSSYTYAGGRYYYASTRSIEVCYREDAYGGEVLSNVVERALSFYDEDFILLPQFMGYEDVYATMESFRLYGFAAPESTVTIYDEDDMVLARTTAEADGYFEAVLINLTEGEKFLTAEDSTGRNYWVSLTVDMTAPVISDISYTFLAEGSAVIRWDCADADIEEFVIYKITNGIREELAFVSGRTDSYNVSIYSDEDVTFAVRAVDYAGNYSEKNVNTADSAVPVAPAAAPEAAKITTTTISLTWTAGSDDKGVDGYVIYRDGEKIGETKGEDALSYTDTGLAQGTEYSYTVKTRDLAGNLSEASAAAIVRTVGLTLTEDIAAENILETYLAKRMPFVVELSADTEDYAAEIKEVSLFYRLQSAEEWQEQSPYLFDLYWDISGDTEGYLPAGTYVVKVRATDAEGAVVETAEKAVVWKNDDIAPSVPGTAEAVSHKSTTITFTWEAATDNVAVDHYEIYRDGEKIGETSETAYTDTELTINTEYLYTMKAVDRRGNTSAASAGSMLKTADLQFGAIIDFTDVYMMEEQKNKEIAVWAMFAPEAGYIPEVTMTMEYQLANSENWTAVTLSADAQYPDSFKGVWSVKGDETGYMQAGLYSVRFRISDGYAEKYSNVQTVILKRDDVAPVVSQVMPDGTTMAGKDGVSVRAYASDNIGVTKYVFSYAPADSTQFTQIAEVETTRAYAEAEWPNTEALPTGRYQLQATAYDLMGNAGSRVVTVNIDNTPPTVPENPSVTGDREKIAVMWTYPVQAGDSDWHHFCVYRSVSADGGFEKVAKINTIGYYDTASTGAAANTVYYYYVTSVDQYGNESAPTAIVSGQIVQDDIFPEIVSVLPTEGTTIRKNATLQISASDNYQLKKCVISYTLEGSGEWTQLAEIENTAVNTAHVYKYVWENIGLESGNYLIQYAVYDLAGNVATEEIRYPFVKYEEPAAPLLTAKADGHKKVALSWNYSGDSDILKNYVLYRSTDGITFNYVMTLNQNVTNYVDQVAFTGAEQKYYYKITATDIYDASAESAAAEVTAVSSDHENPVAVIGPDALKYAEVNEPMMLTAAASTDNDAIASYAWEFGDGATGSGMDVNHVYSAAGEYTVKLTVTDAYGNQAETSCQIIVIDMAEENNGYTRLEIEVCDTTTGKALPGTELLISNEEAGFEETLKTMANGKLTCIVPDGSYKLIAHTEGYISRTIQLEAEGGTEVCRIPMTTGSIMTGTLTAKEMTYDEIIAAGIDPDAEGNQHVYKFETKFTFVVGLEEYEIPYTVFKNEKGKILGSSTGGSGGLGGSGGGGFSNFGGFSIGLFPITENFVLVIYGEAKWLKEMYNVELVVLNQSNVEELQDVRAKLIIPDGLSLADMTYGSQKSEHELGTVGCGQSAKTNWYVRGDEAGEYNLTAEVSAALTYGEVIHQKYTTEKPIRVYAGEALKLTITADDLAKRGEPYTVKYRLENVSDKSLYGLSFGLTASEQYKVIGFGDKNGIVPIESCDFGDAFTRRVDELAPGGYVEMELSTTIWFTSPLEYIEVPYVGAFINPVYYLTDVSVTALEGSTTEIPYDIVINRTERKLLTEKIADEIIKKVYPELSVSGDELLVEFVEGAVGAEMASFTKMVLGMAKGETDYRLAISIDDGLATEDSIYNDIVIITNGGDGQALVDMLDTSISVDTGGLSIKAKAPGSTKVDITVFDPDGKELKVTSMDIVVEDTEMKNEIKLTENSASGSFSINENEFNLAISKQRELELELLNKNPYLWLDSRFNLDVNGSTSNSNYDVTFEAGMLDLLLNQTATAHLDVEGKVAHLSFPREALQTIAEVLDTDFTLYARRLTDAEAENLGSADPTYEFVLKAGNKEVTEFGEGGVYISLPYTLQGGETANDIYVEHIKDDGTIELLSATYDEETKMVTFKGNGFSYYRIRSGGAGRTETVSRVYGLSRCDTAMKAADTLKEVLNISKFDTVIVANAQNFADALGGSYLAAAKDAPILMTNIQSEAKVKDYIRNNLKAGGTIYILGGPLAVASSFETGMDGFHIRRLYGTSRYDTNLEILKEAGVNRGSEVLVCTGTNFADSLSASATGKPILMVGNSLTGTQKTYLESLDADYTIIGGPLAVNTNVEAELKTLGDTARIYGTSRFDTSVVVARTFFRSPSAMVLAYAQNFPDGLSGGPLAYQTNGPLVLTQNGKHAVAAAYADEYDIVGGYVMGGPMLISDDTVKAIFDTDAIIIK